MKLLVATSLVLLSSSTVSCKKEAGISSVKKVYTAECGENDKCIYTEARQYYKPTYNVAYLDGAEVSSRGINVTIVDMLHIGPKSFYDKISSVMGSIVPSTEAKVSSSFSRRSAKREIDLPVVQILEGIACSNQFKVADFSKLKLPNLGETSLPQAEAYKKYKEELFKLNEISSGSDISNFLLSKDCKKDFNLTYNSLIPELNEVTELNFQKQGESKWLEDIENGRIGRTKMLAANGDVELGSIEEKADNIAHFIFMAGAIGANKGLSQKAQSHAMAFGSYFNASDVGVRNIAALNRMEKLINSQALNNFVLPWGANHNPHFETALKEQRYKLKKTEKVLYAKCSDFVEAPASKPVAEYNGAEQMFASYCK